MPASPDRKPPLEPAKPTHVFVLRIFPMDGERRTSRDRIKSELEDVKAGRSSQHNSLADVMERIAEIIGTSRHRNPEPM